MPRFPSWLVWYKKPSYVDVQAFANRLDEKAGSASPRSSGETHRSSCDIPRKLSLERILKNRTCSPMSLYDFYMYLKYIEHSSENLEFYVWFKNYEAGRLTSMVTQADLLVPSHSSLTVSSKTYSQKSLESKSNDGKFSDTTEVEAQDKVGQEEFDVYARIFNFTGPGCGGAGCIDPRPRSGASRIYTSPFSFAGKLDKKDASESKVALVTTTDETDPRRRELDAIKSLFLVPGAPKELNIPSPMRKKALAAIENSTDASHLEAIAEHCHILLKSCSHRNFIRLGVSNGTFETICMATGLGIVLTVMGFLTMFILAFASPSFRHSSRWRGLGVWPMWSIGGGLILSGLRGSCFFLLLFSRRQPLPWERFEDDAVVARERSKLWALVSKLMIFDRKLKVKDDNLRAVQRKVVFQSLFGGMLFATLMTVFFLALPIWEEL